MATCQLTQSNDLLIFCLLIFCLPSPAPIFPLSAWQLTRHQPFSLDSGLSPCTGHRGHRTIRCFKKASTKVQKVLGLHYAVGYSKWKMVMKEVLLMKICKKIYFGHFFSIYTSRLPASCCCGEVRTCHESWGRSASPPIKTLARDPASVELTTPTQVSWRGIVPRRGHSDLWSEYS